MRTPGEWPTKSTQQASYGLMDMPSTGMHVSVPGPLHIPVAVSWVFCRPTNSGKRCISDSLACCCDSFLPIGLPCPDPIWGLLYCLSVSCFVLSGCLFFSEAAGSWSGGRIVGRGEGKVGKMCQRRIYSCIREESIFKNNKSNETTPKDILIYS